MRLLYSDLNIVWVSNYYDGPLEGLCRQNGELMRFEIEEPDEARDDDWYYNCYPLTKYEKVKWVIKQKMFEWCVGYHWTYTNNKRTNFFYYRKPEWLFKLLFKIYYWSMK